MKRIYTLIIFSVILYSCKKEISQDYTKDYLTQVKGALNDSLSKDDFNGLDFSRAVVNKVDSASLYFLRVPFKGKSVAADFVMVKTNKKGEVERGSIIHLEGKVNESGSVRSKRLGFDGKLSISSLNRKEILISDINQGYIAAFHPQMNAREQLKEDNVMPEVVIVTYISSGINYSTWLWLSGLYYNYDTGEGSGSYYGSVDGSGGYYYSGGGGSYGDTSGGSTVTEDETMLVDVDTYADKDPVDIEQYLKCFDNISDEGAQCEIGIYADIPVDSDPNKIFDFSTGSPGHTFIQIKKTSADYSQSVVQYIGFYPRSGWKTITNLPMEAKFVNDGWHEFNAGFTKTVTNEQLKLVIAHMRNLKDSQYDLDNFNCTDWALSVFNSQGYTLTIPRYLVPGSIRADGVNTPQGVYAKLMEMKTANVVNSDKIRIGFLKGYVPSSKGACY